MVRRFIASIHLPSENNERTNPQGWSVRYVRVLGGSQHLVVVTDIEGTGLYNTEQYRMTRVRPRSRIEIWIMRF